MTEENLSDLSGEKNIKQASRYNVPLLRLQGKEGKFHKIIIGGEKTEDILIDDKIEGVMLKVRRSYAEFTKEERLFTNEHNSWKDNVTLFESKKTEKGITTRMVDSGMAGDLKKKYPGLKMQQSIYFLLQPENEIVKLLVKGKGLSNLFDYWKAFESDEHIYQFITKLNLIEEESPLGPYYAMTFERGKKIDGVLIEKVAEKIKEVASKIGEIDSFYTDRRVPDEIRAEGPNVPEEEIPVINEEEPVKSKKKDKDEIDVDKIPF